MSFKLVETVTLASDVNTISFLSIPQDGSDLMVIASLRHSSGTGLEDVIIRFNNAALTMASTRLEGDGSAISVATRTTEIRGNNEIPPGSSANYGNLILYINDYTNTAFNKTVDYFSGGETGAATAHMNLLTGRWGDTSVGISEVGIRASAQFFTAGSNASLYKITKP